MKVLKVIPVAALVAITSTDSAFAADPPRSGHRPNTIADTVLVRRKIPALVRAGPARHERGNRCGGSVKLRVARMADRSFGRYFVLRPNANVGYGVCSLDRPVLAGSCRTRTRPIADVGLATPSFSRSAPKRRQDIQPGKSD
jgi:hypothetical protein